jgi:arylsulfatase
MQTSHIAVHLEDNEYLKTLPDNWYSSDYYADKMIGYLKDRADRNEERPFFGYLAFTAPHWPLQAPQELIQHYKGVYDDGPEALRQRRMKRMIELGLMDPNTEPHPVVADEALEWEKLSDEERAKSARSMEAYSGMVEVRYILIKLLTVLLTISSPWISILERSLMNSRSRENWIILSSCFSATTALKGQRTKPTQ